MLFNLCGEMIMRMVSEDLPEESGITIRGRNIWNIRYADDTTLIATSKEYLETQAAVLKKHSLKFGLKINSAKTFVMTLDKNPQPVHLNNVPVEQVQSFNYLGSVITTDNNCSIEIKKRINVAKNTTQQLAPIWKSSDIGLQLKKQLMKSLDWSVVLYGAESWALKQSDEKSI
jgi:hypothetical protein